MAADLKRAILGGTRQAAPKLAPLGARKAAARALNRIPGRYKEALILALLHDWATGDPAAYHQFIWANHLSYAQYYELGRDGLAGRGTYFTRMHPLRVELFELVSSYLRGQGVDPLTEVGSLLDVGTSMGYLPYYAETTAFPGARRLLGIDIDAHAIADGITYLNGVGSSVELKVADIYGLEAVVGDERFDVVSCTGVLQYLEEEAATRAVGAMLARATKVLALSGLVDPDVDNGTLARSGVRDYDRSFIHNFDRMVAAHGGRVVARRWGGREFVEGLGAYLVVATPA